MLNLLQLKPPTYKKVNFFLLENKMDTFTCKDELLTSQSQIFNFSFKISFVFVFVLPLFKVKFDAFLFGRYVVYNSPNLKIEIKAKKYSSYLFID